MVQDKLEKEVEERIRRGESCPWFRAFFSLIKQQSEEAKKQALERQGQGFAGHAQRVALEKYLTEMENASDLPMVKLGDASVAAPFTSKTPSIQATVDIIKQGRCALVTTLQMYQILALNCLISAYSLSVLYLDGIKYGDSQMMASGILMTISFLTLSRATPLNELSVVRPLTTIFHPALFVSLIGQFVIHLGCMVYGTYLTKIHSPDWVPNLYGKFQPSLLNTVVFLMSTVQSVSVFVTNYKGRPFMISIVDNPGLLYSLGLCLIGVLFAATEALPTFNKILQLVPFPNSQFAETILMLLILNIISTLTWDFLMSIIFYPEMVKESFRAVGRDDVYKLCKMVFIMYLLISILTPAEEDLQKIQEEFAKWN
jgi:cation-transporting ATPase 13A1